MGCGGVMLALATPAFHVSCAEATGVSKKQRTATAMIRMSLTSFSEANFGAGIKERRARGLTVSGATSSFEAICLQFAVRMNSTC